MLSNLEYEQDWASKEKTYTLKDKFVGHVSDDGYRVSETYFPNLRVHVFSLNV